jgi:hypothetical protein
VINLDSIDRESFDIDDTPHGILITPKRGKVEYLPHEIGLRSVLCAPDGRVLSRGLPKFFNHGENAAHDAETRRLLATGAVCHYTEKLDGTLIILSVIDGHPHFRTRGNDTLGDFEGPVMALVRERYPEVLDTDHWCSSDFACSLVMEYTAPTNRIVVTYDEARLTALGFVQHDTGAFWPAAEGIEARLGTAKPRIRTLSTDLDTAAREAAEMTGDEGVVAWIERGPRDWHLVKMKSLWWLRAHALASFATYDRVREFMWANCINGASELLSALQAAGVDYEIASQHLGLFERVRGDLSSRRAALATARARVEDIRALPDRRTKAQALQAREPELFGVLIFDVTGETEKFREAAEAYIWGWTRTQLVNLKKKPRAALVLDLEAAKQES